MTMNAEAVAKLAEVLLSHRIATNIVLGTLILVGTASAFLGLLPSEKLISQLPALAPLLLLLLTLAVVVSYSVASLITGAVIGLYRFIRGRDEASRVLQRQELQRRQEAQKREDGRRRKIAQLRSVLPDLPPSHHAVLKRFYEAGERYVTLDGGTVIENAALVKAGFIQEVLEVRTSAAMYRLHPDAQAAVREYFDEQQRQAMEAHRLRVRAAVSEADEAARELLRLFGREGPQAPGEPSHPWMEYLVYASVQPLVRAGVLIYEPKDKREAAKDTERIGLTSEAMEPLEQLVLGCPISRRTVLLDRRRIVSSMDRGGGVRRSLADGIPYVWQSGTGSSTTG